MLGNTPHIEPQRLKEAQRNGYRPYAPLSTFGQIIFIRSKSVIWIINQNSEVFIIFSTIKLKPKNLITPSMKPSIIILFFFLSLNVSSQVRMDSLDVALEAYINKSLVNGMAVAICTADSLLYAKGFGYADTDKGTPYTIHTIQPIASITKTLVGFSLMKAQELGKLDLDDDINLYLPFPIVNPHYPKDTIRIRHLATHSSSLKDRRLSESGYIFSGRIPPLYKELPLGPKRMLVRSYLKQYNTNVDLPVEEFLKNPYHPDGEWYSKRNFAKKRPGEKYEYSNNGTALAALILEYATGMNFNAFVRLHILDPLGMELSGKELTDYHEDQRSKLYLLSHEVPDYASITHGDGDFTTSISEFSRYFMEVMQGYSGTGSLLQPSSYKEMLSYQISPEFRQGIFWDIQPKSIGHNGGDLGISTFAYFNKNGTKGMLIFMNTSDFENSLKNQKEVLQILIDNSN